MALQVHPAHPNFFAEISGVDVSQPLTPAVQQAITDAINHYAVVLFRGQTLTNETQRAFAENFGELERPGQTYNPDNKFRAEAAGIADASNLDEHGRPRGIGDRRRMENLRNFLWHTDASFRAIPGALSMLYAHAVPAEDEGGETEFADLRAAYDALPQKTKEKIEPLIAEHSHINSRIFLGNPQGASEELGGLPPVPQRVVRRHPGSLRKTLYIGAHASHIIGWPVPEGRFLLLDLLEHATQRAFVHRHSWRVGDFVIWDNRCTLHRGRPFEPTLVRDLRRVTTRDVASTLDQTA